MTRRRKLLLSIAALALGLVAVQLIRNREPRHQGRTISEWADIGLKATDTVPWDMPNVLLASNAFRRIGAPALEVRFFMTNYQSGFGMKAAQWASKMGTPGEAVAGWLEDSAAREWDALYDRSSFIAYSLAADTNLHLPRLLSDEYLNTSGVAAALDESHAPMLANILLTETNQTGVNARMVLFFMGDKASSADPILRPFVAKYRNHPNWKSAVRILARGDQQPEDTVQLILGDSALTATEKLDVLALMDGIGIRATVGFLSDTNAVVRGRALLQMILHAEHLHSLDQTSQPVFRLSQGGGTPPPLVFAANWFPPTELMDALDVDGPGSKLAAINVATELARLSAKPRESAALRYRDIDATYWRPAIRVFIEALAKDPDPRVSQAAANALDGFRLPKGP
jgi:hypothetical protein